MHIIILNIQLIAVYLRIPMIVPYFSVIILDGLKVVATAAAAAADGGSAAHQNTIRNIQTTVFYVHIAVHHHQQSTRHTYLHSAFSGRWYSILLLLLFYVHLTGFTSSLLFVQTIFIKTIFFFNFILKINIFFLLMCISRRVVHCQYIDKIKKK